MWASRIYRLTVINKLLTFFEWAYYFHAYALKSADCNFFALNYLKKKNWMWNSFLIRCREKNNIARYISLNIRWFQRAKYTSYLVTQRKVNVNNVCLPAILAGVALLRLKNKKKEHISRSNQQTIDPPLFLTATRLSLGPRYIFCFLFHTLLTRM